MWTRETFFCARVSHTPMARSRGSRRTRRSGSKKKQRSSVHRRSGTRSQRRYRSALDDQGIQNDKLTEFVTSGRIAYANSGGVSRHISQLSVTNAGTLSVGDIAVMHTDDELASDPDTPFASFLKPVHKKFEIDVIRIVSSPIGDILRIFPKRGTVKRVQQDGEGNWVDVE